MSQQINHVIKEQAILLEVGDLLSRLRREKQWRQKNVSEKLGIGRQALWKLENGKKAKIDLVRLAQIVNFYGEELIITTSNQNKQSLTTTYAEDKVLIAFAEGRIEDAEEGLEELKNWVYPFYRIEAKCKRDMAIAISLHFKGESSRSYTLMNDLVMGLATLKYSKEVDHFVEIYSRLISEGKVATSEGKEGEE